MPPPSSCSKVSTRSTGDHENECDTKTSKSYTSTLVSADDATINSNRCEGVGLVKSLLGPSFEDAVLRTLEFGKSLIQKPNDNQVKSRNRKEQSKRSKSNQKKLLNRPHEHTRSDDGKCVDVNNATRYHCDKRPVRKRIVYTTKTDKDWPILNSPTGGKKLISVSKIRSLDSDLKQVAPSPEKIKRQLEALIQINRDEPPEHVNGWTHLQKNMKLPLELTVMPNMCLYGQEGDVRCTSSCEVQSLRRQGMESSQSPTPRHQACVTLSQAPEFLSNALGPTLDVSIIENIKMMRNLLKCDKGGGVGGGVGEGGEGVDGIQKEYVPCEEPPEACEDKRVQCDGPQDLLEELQNKIKELEEKEQYLLKQLDDAKNNKGLKDKKCPSFQFLKECSHKKSSVSCKRSATSCQRSVTSCKSADSKVETLQKKIVSEEEKLKRIRCQIDRCKKELNDMKCRRDSLKRNKSLLDAWDVIASRVCHTRLPSFSRAGNLERKDMKSPSSPANLHCCFSDHEQAPCDASGKRSRSRSQASRRETCESRCTSRGTSRCPSRCTSHSESRPGSANEDIVFRIRQACIPFPCQRDLTCGMHEVLKKCNCKGDYRGDDGDFSTDDEQIKRTGLMTKVPDKIACRSKSDTMVKRDRGTKIVKVMWAVTRINIFQDNCRTYEVMDATSTPPPCLPARTEGIFVVKNPDRKTSNRKKTTCRGRKT